MEIGMFDRSSVGTRLPHPPLSLRSQLVVEAAIRATWELMREDPRGQFQLETALEDEVTHELYERLYDEVFDSGMIAGFDREVFASVHREPKIRNFNGANLDKMPDLFVDFIDRPAGIMHSQHGLFIECKPVDANHTVGACYCDMGLSRFVRGDYAWAMTSALMVGYSREGYLIWPKLGDALIGSRKQPISHLSGPDACVHGRGTTYAEQVSITVHGRIFIYVGSGNSPGPITIRHLWLKRGA